MKNYYIGIMSGTSLDGIDAVLAEISSKGQLQVLQHVDIPMDSGLRKTFFELQKPSENELHLEALAANQLALHYNLAVEKCLAQAKLSPQEIMAIGAHGQTIRHQPGLHDGLGYTRQSLNPSLLAEKSGIDVIADFRSRDIAAGGQGAPLVPAFHWAQFAQTKALAVLNIGGISNLSLLPSTQEPSHPMVTGLDCGPGNALMDYWTHLHLQKSFDENGQWASQGQVIQKLLDSFLSEPYFSKPAPKSTGRDLFNPDWLEKHLKATQCLQSAPQDIQATLLELTAQSVAIALKQYAPHTKQMVVCGGGAKNQALVKAIERLCPALEEAVKTTAHFGIDPQAVEAAAFAWLAWAHQAKQPANLPAVTGADGLRILGAHYPA
jgi:anhydro-N-acetylmuramic acid kinase